jgi:uncharacterized protein (DUF983 family)
VSTVPPRPGALLILRRAFRRRCPNCGAGGIFSSWFRMVARCPQCGLLLERGEHGYQVGSYMFNIAAAELVFLAVFLGLLAATWPDPPWILLTWVAGVLVVILPLLFYPFSKTLFLGFDLIFNPAQPSDIRET